MSVPRATAQAVGRSIPSLARNAGASSFPSSGLGGPVVVIAQGGGVTVTAQLIVTHNKAPWIAAMLPNAAEAVIDATAEFIREEIVNSMASSGGGITYYSRTRGTHTASSPGEPPATWTGELAGGVEIRKIAKHEVWVVEGSAGGGEYAAALEFGRADGSIAPRPHFKPAVQRAIPYMSVRMEALAAQIGLL